MLQPEDLTAAGLTEVAEGHDLLGPPAEQTTAPVDPLLPLLPTDLMHWTQFERLLMRVAKEVRGLRSVALMGDPGQKQEGLDVIGLDAAGDAEGIQSKKYVKFTKGDLNAAVKKFDEGTLPFPVRRLAIGVACTGHEAKVVTRLVEINKDRDDLEVDIWDKERLSEMLRDRPDIVREFFGAATAASFCVPHHVDPVVVPAPDAVTLATAVLAGPATGTGARELLAAADHADADEPEDAVRLVREAQAALESAGFDAHARVLDDRVVELLLRLHRRPEAARLLLDRFWSQLAADQADSAVTTLRALERLDEPAEGSTGPVDGAASAGDPFVQAAVRTATRASRVYGNPFGHTDLAAAGDPEPLLPIDAARLLLLVGESAVADESALTAQPFMDAVDRVASDDRALAVRLRLVAADADGGWTDLLHEARTRVHGRDLAALIFARYARHRAVRGDFADADAAWAEAVEQACLVRRHEDAAAWLYARRTLAARYRVFVDDVYHPLASALNSRPDKPRLVAAGRRTRERALDALHRDKARAAVARLRRYLVDAVASGSWQEEHDARELLADCYTDSGDHALAAEQLVLAGRKKPLAALAEKAGDALLPVQPYLSSPLYWVQATAFSALAAQADLVPDPDVAGLVDQALAVLDDGAAGTLVDTPLFGPSKYLAAHDLLASVIGRATTEQAARYLALVKDAAPREPGTYRHTDDDHAKALAEIGLTQPELTDDAVEQLLTMLEGRTHGAERYGHRLLTSGLDRPGVRERLAALAVDGNSAAAELLAAATKPDVATSDDLTAAEAAAEGLLAASDSGPGFYARGTGAVRQSVLARFLPPDRRVELVRAQLGRARLPHENSGNRTEYLLAAANLTEDLPDDDARALHQAALREAADPAPSLADELTAQSSHPFGAFRINDKQDSRPAGALLAARLARTPDEKRAARDAALGLVGADDGADYRIANALQQLDADLDDVLPYLSTLGWALRSLAAIHWAGSSTAPPEIGVRLASDPDPRVRRALARELASAEPAKRTDAARARLGQDARHSVRSLLDPTAQPLA
ncbi:MAG: hypothetical protein JWO60_3435 [Frankiales bacterium]|nr:hypothetical protein [Frankiales bacterium]